MTKAIHKVDDPKTGPPSVASEADAARRASRLKTIRERTTAMNKKEVTQAVADRLVLSPSLVEEIVDAVQAEIVGARPGASALRSGTSAAGR